MKWQISGVNIVIYVVNTAFPLTPTLEAETKEILRWRCYFIQRSVNPTDL